MTKTWNSYLAPRLPNWVFSLFYAKVLNSGSFLWRLLFYPLRRLNLLQQDINSWIKINSLDSHRFSLQYINLNPPDYFLLEGFKNIITNRSQPVLDFGCNTGTYLTYLIDHGFTDPYGVDISEAAASQFSTHFPKSKTLPTFICKPAELYLPSIPPNFFAGLVSRGAVIELIPVGFDAVHHLCRVVRHVIALRVDEDGHSTPRWYEAEFARGGFLLSQLRRFDQRRDSVMIFTKS